VTDGGGPKFIVRHGETGFIAKNFEEFVKYSLELMDNSDKLNNMKTKSREFALSRSWNAVFESVYAAYDEAYTMNLEQKEADLLNKVK
jgi:glycosyltransferase involved in cell wall biosynthesis